jgi:hypothetical protein
MLVIALEWKPMFLTETTKTGGEIALGDRLTSVRGTDGRCPSK